MKPKIYRDDFWGDVCNALLLAPVYREPHSLEAEVKDTLERKNRHTPPKPKPKSVPITIQKVHNCPKYDWEYDENGNRVPNGTIVECPDCGDWWGMENGNMRIIQGFERICVKASLKAISVLSRKKPS